MRILENLIEGDKPDIWFKTRHILYNSLNEKDKPLVNPTDWGFFLTAFGENYILIVTSPAGAFQCLDFTDAGFGNLPNPFILWVEIIDQERPMMNINHLNILGQWPVNELGKVINKKDLLAYEKEFCRE